MSCVAFCFCKIKRIILHTLQGCFDGKISVAWDCKFHEISSAGGLLTIASPSSFVMPDMWWPMTQVFWDIIVNHKGFPCSSDGKASAYNAGDQGSIPGLGRSSGEGNGNPLQYSCLQNPMDRGAWKPTVHAVAKSWTWLNGFSSLHFIESQCCFEGLVIYMRNYLEL